MTKEKPIFVTKPSLPPLEDLQAKLGTIWSSGILTNGGPLHEELEAELCKYLGVEHISLFANGTLALLIALKSARLTGEIITSPFSFVATSQAISWNNLTPIFADINPDTYTLDPDSIVKCISSRTTAILPVHCYGIPCEVDTINQIAEDYNLKVIYDAAHAFGVSCHCGSILNHGDLSILSFHATKVFNTFEGGAIISPDAKTKSKIDRLKNFGFIDQENVASNGINAKMSELNAAVGLCQLKYIDSAIENRKTISEIYDKHLTTHPLIKRPTLNDIQKYNYSYYPIRLVSDDSSANLRDYIFDQLKADNIFCRKYFYPLISEFQLYKNDANKTPYAITVANQVLCLPIYPELSKSNATRIATHVLKAIETYIKEKI
tara:strand:- start:1483 stop:2616 length:1134 start_codon:yes stop_codon:yes gene_type:complete